MNAKSMGREPGWDGALYHRISAPQASWGLKVLERLSLRGDETVLDLGCGTGRLTAQLLDQLPRGRLIAIDRDRSMVREARLNLTASAVDRRWMVVRGDVSSLPAHFSADLVFSTATFHWVTDAPRLYAELFAALKPGGRLEAQCGGGPNIARLRGRVAGLMHSSDYAGNFAGWTEPWRFDDERAAAQDLRAAGFVDVETWIEESPTPLVDRAAYREFIASMILRPHLAAIDDPSRRAAFLEVLVEQASSDQPPYLLDYWRLNLRAARPA